MQIARSASADVQNEMSTLWTLLNVLPIKHPGLNFSQKVSITRPGLFQVLKTSVCT